MPCEERNRKVLSGPSVGRWPVEAQRQSWGLGLLQQPLRIQGVPSSPSCHPTTGTQTHQPHQKPSLFKKTKRRIQQQLRIQGAPSTLPWKPPVSVQPISLPKSQADSKNQWKNPAAAQDSGSTFLPAAQPRAPNPSASRKPSLSKKPKEESSSSSGFKERLPLLPATQPPPPNLSASPKAKFIQKTSRGIKRQSLPEKRF